MGLTLVVAGRRGGLKEPNLPPPLQCPPRLAQGWGGDARCQLPPGLRPPPHWVTAGSVAHRVSLFCLNSCRNLSLNALESLSWKTVQGLSLQEL